MKLMGRKKTVSLASSVALRVSLAVADESFCCVRLKYCRARQRELAGQGRAGECSNIRCLTGR